MNAHRLVRTSLLAALACVALAATAAATEAPVAISGSAPKTVKHGAKLLAKVKFAVPAGFHIYSPTYKDTGIPVSFELVGAPSGYKVLPPTAPKGGELKGNIVMTVPIWVPKTAKGKQSLSLKVNYQQCNDRICLPPSSATVSLHTVVK